MISSNAAHGVGRNNLLIELILQHMTAIFLNESKNVPSDMNGDWNRDRIAGRYDRAFLDRVSPAHARAEITLAAVNRQWRRFALAMRGGTAALDFYSRSNKVDKLITGIRVLSADDDRVKQCRRLAIVYRFYSSDPSTARRIWSEYLTHILSKVRLNQLESLNLGTISEDDMILNLFSKKIEMGEQFSRLKSFSAKCIKDGKKLGNLLATAMVVSGGCLESINIQGSSENFWSGFTSYGIVFAGLQRISFQESSDSGIENLAEFSPNLTVLHIKDHTQDSKITEFKPKFENLTFLDADIYYPNHIQQYLSCPNNLTTLILNCSELEDFTDSELVWNILLTSLKSCRCLKNLKLVWWLQLAALANVLQAAGANLETLFVGPMPAEYASGFDTFFMGVPHLGFPRVVNEEGYESFSDWTLRAMQILQNFSPLLKRVHFLMDRDLKTLELSSNALNAFHDQLGFQFSSSRYN
ncbi:hypothetical protein HK100_000910 [Physocladia obscura]|uniref:Uncharacterized protein n=1 Tax=Physocladia obscura TaxID=109957 RepID=A0AAD5SXZ2_9FUNG|nr:hypothetical protein HK100_000910 [Physocladia obscura]